MASPFDVLLRSRPITFVLGQAKTKFTIHADALTSHSKALRVLLDGDMKEAKEDCVVWDDVDNDTFVRFAQWAYSNDYVPPDPDILLDSSNISIQPTSCIDPPSQPKENQFSIQERSEGIPTHIKPCGCGYKGYGYGSRDVGCTKCGIYYKAKTCGSCGRTLEGCANCRKGAKGALIPKGFTTSTTWRVNNHAFQPRQNKEECEDYSKVFLCHANLYILADKYDVIELRKISMHKLYATLVTFKIYPSRVPDILSLVELVYENTREDDELRSMLVHYCACIVEQLAKCGKFQPTLQAYPEFSFALMVKMTERLD